MNNRVRSPQQEKAWQILDESRSLKSAFADQRNKVMGKVNSFQYSIEDAILSKLETVVRKCETLAILQLTRSGTAPDSHSPISINLVEDRKIAQHMIAEVSQMPIPDEYPSLQSLRTMLLSCSFLPDPAQETRQDSMNLISEQAAYDNLHNIEPLCKETGPMNCWEIMQCSTKEACPAFPWNGMTCAIVLGTICHGDVQNSYGDKIKYCSTCGYMSSRFFVGKTSP